jgi:hypothetical protein
MESETKNWMSRVLSWKNDYGSGASEEQWSVNFSLGSSIKQSSNLICEPISELYNQTRVSKREPIELAFFPAVRRSRHLVTQCFCYTIIVIVGCTVRLRSRQRHETAEEPFRPGVTAERALSKQGASDRIQAGLPFACIKLSLFSHSRSQVDSADAIRQHSFDNKQRRTPSFVFFYRQIKLIMRATNISMW